MRILVLAFLSGGLLAQSQEACKVVTMVGSPIPDSGDEGPALRAGISNIAAAAYDVHGNLLIAGGRKVRIVSTDGTIRTFAGDGQHGYLGDGGPALRARFRSIASMRIDLLGNVYVADPLSHVVRKIDSSGVIMTIAGTGVGGFNGFGGEATAIQLNQPSSIAVDATGNVFIADSGNNLVRRVEPSGRITSVAGSGISSVSLEFPDGLEATQAAITPWRIGLDADGHLLILDTMSRLFRVTGTTIAVLSGGEQLLLDGSATKTVRFGISGFEVSNAGELLLETVDTGQTASGVTRWVKLREDGVFVPVPGSSSRLVGFTARDLPLAASRDGVLKQLLDGQMVPLAGESSAGSSGDGGPGTSAKLQEPSSLATDADGNLFIVDAANWRVRKLSVSGTISTYYVSSDASDLPRFVSTDQHGAVYVASSGLGRVRKFDSVGSIAQVLGGDRPAPRLGEQPAEDTAVSNITGFQADGDGNLILTSLGITGFWQISAETGLIGRRLQGDTYQIVGRNREHGALALRPGVGLFQLTAKLPAAPLIAPEGQMFLGGSYATDPISGSVFYIQASNLMRLDRDGLIHTSVSASDPDNAFAAATPASTPLNIEFNQRGDLFFTDEQHRVKMLTQAASCGEQAVAR